MLEISVRNQSELYRASIGTFFLSNDIFSTHLDEFVQQYNDFHDYTLEFLPIYLPRLRDTDKHLYNLQLKKLGINDCGKPAFDLISAVRYFYDVILPKYADELSEFNKFANGSGPEDYDISRFGGICAELLECVKDLNKNFLKSYDSKDGELQFLNIFKEVICEFTRLLKLQIKNQREYVSYSGISQSCMEDYIRQHRITAQLIEELTPVYQKALEDLPAQG